MNKITKEEIFEQLLPIIEYQLFIPQDAISLETKLVKDNFLIKDMFLKIEEKFEIKISESSFQKIETVDNLVDYLSRIL